MSHRCVGQAGSEGLVTEHPRDALGERTRSELTDLFASLDQPAHVSGFGSVFVTYFMEGPVNDYSDLLRNDVELFTEIRMAEMKHGVFELPLNLKRSHYSYAHTEEDVDTLLAATEAAYNDVKGS